MRGLACETFKVSRAYSVLHGAHAYDGVNLDTGCSAL
jgi:hypothetical protein